MSLQFVIDGYNIIHHTQFNTHTARKTKDPRKHLLEFIKIKHLCGSLKNKVIVVFDGFPKPLETQAGEIEVIFSREQSADEKIKRIVEASPRPKDIIVVSDDKEIRYIARLSGAKALGVEEFLPQKPASGQPNSDLLKPELSFSQRDKINKELARLWLKK